MAWFLWYFINALLFLVGIVISYLVFGPSLKTGEPPEPNTKLLAATLLAGTLTGLSFWNIVWPSCSPFLPLSMR